MYNVEIRNAIKKAGLFGYELAAALGVSETSFSRKLARKELPIDQKKHFCLLPAIFTENLMTADPRTAHAIVFLLVQPTGTNFFQTQREIEGGFLYG